jgi:hypothetical protein
MEKLRLPSEFTFEARNRLGLEDLARTEYQLHLGQAHDSLEKLRGALGLKSFLIHQKYKNAGSQGALTGSESQVDRATRHVLKWQQVYKRPWEALGRLSDGRSQYGMEGSRQQLPELKEDDCVMLSGWMEEHRFWRAQGELAESQASEKGKGRRELPWFWKIHIEGNPQKDTDDIDGSIAAWATNGMYTYHS